MERRRTTRLPDASVRLTKAELAGQLEQLRRRVRELETAEAAREQLRQSLLREKRFTEGLINSLPGVFYLFDSQGRFLRWNENLERATGYAGGEITRRHPLDFFAGKDRDLVEARIRETFTTGRATAEASLVSKNGTSTPYCFTGLRLVLDGTPCLVGLGLDISERKHVEAELQRYGERLEEQVAERTAQLTLSNRTLRREIEERERAEAELRQGQAMLAHIIDSIPQAVFWKDRRSAYLGCNATFAATVGLGDPRQVVGKTDYDLPLPQAEVEAYRADDREVIESNRSKRHIIEPVQRADGTRLWVDTTKVPLTDEEGRVYGVLGVFDDITQRKLAEEELQRSKNRVRELSTRLEEFQESERRRLALELHDQVGQKLSALGIILNIVHKKLSRGSSEEVSARIADSIGLLEETTECVRDVMASLRPPVLDDYGLPAALRWYGKTFSERTGIPVEYQGEGTVPRSSRQIETALFRIAQEALNNVAKHSRASRATISIGVEGATVRLIIADDGMGFECSQRLTRAEQASWGLMGMVERAEAVGGRCRIESTVGAGTRVIVEVGG